MSGELASEGPRDFDEETRATFEAGAQDYAEVNHADMIGVRVRIVSWNAVRCLGPGLGNWRATRCALLPCAARLRVSSPSE